MLDATRYMTSPMAARKYVQETYGTSQGNTWRTQVLTRHFACDIDYYGWHRRIYGTPGFEIISKTKSMSGWYVAVDVTYRVAC